MVKKKKTITPHDRYVQRIKELMSKKYDELSDEDKIHKVLIKIVLDSNQYRLLSNVYNKGFSIEHIASLTGRNKLEIKSELSGIISELKLFVWSYRNSPFIKDEDRDKIVSKKEWIGDKVLNGFIENDLIIMSVDEYLNQWIAYQNNDEVSQTNN